MFIVNAKVKQLVYSGNTVLFLLPNRKYMREHNFFLSPSPSMTLCSISSDVLFKKNISQLYNYHYISNIYIYIYIYTYNVIVH